MDRQQPSKKILQMEFPVVWLLTTAATVVFLTGSLIFQLNSATTGIADLKAALVEMKITQEKRDDRLTLVSASNIELRSQMNNLQVQLTRLDNDLAEIRKDAADQRRNQRWVPK